MEVVLGLGKKTICIKVKDNLWNFHLDEEKRQKTFSYRVKNYGCTCFYLNKKKMMFFNSHNFSSLAVVSEKYLL